MNKLLPKLTSGPGILSKAMGISIYNSGVSLLDKHIWIENRSNNPLKNFKIITSPRVGVKYSGKDASNPWRFTVEGNPWVSSAK